MLHKPQRKTTLFGLVTFTSNGDIIFIFIVLVNLVFPFYRKSVKMNTNTLLHTNREEVRKAVLEKLGKTEQDVQEDMQLIKNWLQYQKHLPEIPCKYIALLY